ncbi:hypothetical protein E3N88_44721 [Mikania micrantha]|uniref:Reverse transcriptase domain-containing protein n=1 Tax=Mikania micrantha TaxID=192012 RepID=A0A5N6LBU6_9ASTR|nr:hypothetical protein E3N88_44721 [Mikania micrantha]
MVGYHASIGMPPYEALYGRRCKTPVCWGGIGQKEVGSKAAVIDLTEKLQLVKERMKAAQDRQKSYADKRRRPIRVEVADQVLLEVSPWTGVIRFGKREKLNTRLMSRMKCKTLDRGRGGNVVLPAAVGQNMSTAVKGAAYVYDGLNDLNHVMMYVKKSCTGMSRQFRLMVKESCGNIGLPTVCRHCGLIVLKKSYACMSYQLLDDSMREMVNVGENRARNGVTDCPELQTKKNFKVWNFWARRVLGNTAWQALRGHQSVSSFKTMKDTLWQALRDHSRCLLVPTVKNT